MSDDRILDPELVAIVEAMTATQVKKFLRSISYARQYSDLTEPQKDVLSVIRRKHAKWAMRRLN
jgi:replicative superfamily II helicase